MGNKRETFDGDLMEMLQDDKFAIDYIFEAIAEGDEELTLAALNDIRRSTKPEQTQEVEEGKAHVMRWVEVKDDDRFERENVLVNSIYEEASVCYGVNGDDDFFYATFNNNNGEIPMPKEGE